MRSLFAATLGALAVAGLTASPALPATWGSLREAGHAARMADDGAAPRVHQAKAVMGEDDGARLHRVARRPERLPVRPYPVRSRPVGSSRTGVASYYGSQFHGRRTASGARFDANGLTAAHRTLPLGTRVRVTNLSNGRSVDVLINDRGPYIRGRMIDLSRGAAKKLRMQRQGVARVKVTVLGR